MFHVRPQFLLNHVELCMDRDNDEIWKFYVFIE
jgi:hypothetical protein